MLSSMPCTVLTSPARSGLPSTNTPGGGGGFHRIQVPRPASLHEHVRAERRDAPGRLLVRLAVPRIAERVDGPQVLVRLDVLARVREGSGDPRPATRASRATPRPPAEPPSGPGLEFLLAGVLAGADGSAPDSEPLSPTACDEEESVCVSVSTETSVTSSAAAEVSNGWNARAKATRGAAPTARATPSSTVSFTVKSIVRSSGSNTV